MTVAVDFDGTIVTHMYPAIGEPVPMALTVMRQLLAQGHTLILWTMRDGTQLQEAEDYLRANGITEFHTNHNPSQCSWTKSPKAYAHVYIDDAALGCPLVFPTDGMRPYVDWEVVARRLL